ncbi:MAG: helix-turn-helix transcriptional regulator [Pseudomonadales bacterium]|nr:helix-turn-helix transcriptional regulator [Pseudomonadales bacterium]
MIDEICINIHKLRRQKKWSQAYLGQLVGLDRTTIGLIERGDFNDIGIRKIERILNVLGKDLSLVNYGLPTLDQLQENE